MKYALRDFGGRTVWHLDVGGETRVVVTSEGSNASIDRAVSRYDATLKRLAEE